MFTVELYAKIRRAVMIEGLSRREAAKRFGDHRNTIWKMLSFYLLRAAFPECATSVHYK
jgi:transposase